ncbi:hypothetical protein BACI348_50444 [Bacillus altitudinis]|uniref:Uncharacterized protein n=1 Tax=Bacillus altitudinis TaxID=293387 RepID=A0A653WCX5_BACAB|nr:hypothetical protein BACI348_50444 [Bacillus altitudinis]
MPRGYSHEEPFSFIARLTAEGSCGAIHGAHTVTMSRRPSSTTQIEITF